MSGGLAKAHSVSSFSAPTTATGGGPQLQGDDTRLGLGRLAAAWRARFALPVLALTGSNGKTTVKEMVASILAAHCGGPGAVLATEGNLNNDIGLPLMLLRLRDRHRYGVFEMGMNHEGEIDYLTRLASPGVALVNNAQRAHVGLLGSVEAVARAKGEIYGGLGAGGVALVNADDAFAPYWRRLNAARRVVDFGMAEGADVRGRLEDGKLRLVTPTDAFAVTLQVPGEHNARNAVAACAAAFTAASTTSGVANVTRPVRAPVAGLNTSPVRSASSWPRTASSRPSRSSARTSTRRRSASWTSASA